MSNNRPLHLFFAEIKKYSKKKPTIYYQMLRDIMKIDGFSGKNPISTLFTRQKEWLNILIDDYSSAQINYFIEICNNYNEEHDTGEPEISLESIDSDSESDSEPEAEPKITIKTKPKPKLAIKSKVITISIFQKGGTVFQMSIPV
jgi:hypothetical protein